MEVVILEEGFDKVEAQLTDMGERAINNAEPLAEIVVDLFRVEAAIFSSQGRRGGGSWKPLSDDYVAYERAGSYYPILRFPGSDLLYRSLTEEGATYQILDVGHNDIIFGTDRPFAAVTQSGSGDGRIPARPFMRFLPTDIDRWTRIMLQHVVKPFRSGTTAGDA